MKAARCMAHSHLERISEVDVFGFLQSQWYHRHCRFLAESGNTNIAQLNRFVGVGPS